MTIRHATHHDADAVAAIYNHYIEHTVITFETEPVLSSEMAQRISSLTTTFPWIILEEQGQILGYAFAYQWKSRQAFRYCVESSVYLLPDATGKGYGRTLYQELLARLEDCDVHTVIAGIALPNPTSIALHEKLGFRKVGYLHEAGWKFERWIDLGYWELTLTQHTPKS